jgi:hypothetical protein
MIVLEPFRIVHFQISTGVRVSPPFMTQRLQPVDSIIGEI